MAAKWFNSLDTNSRWTGYRAWEMEKYGNSEATAAKHIKENIDDITLQSWVFNRQSHPLFWWKFLSESLRIQHRFTCHLFNTPYLTDSYISFTLKLEFWQNFCFNRSIRSCTCGKKNISDFPACGKMVIFVTEIVIFFKTTK